MPAFFEYLRNITYYLLFAALVGLIAPTGKYKKFVSLVMGLIMLVLLLQPLRSLGNQIPVTEWFAGIIPIPAYSLTSSDDAYATWRETYLAAAFNAQLSAQLEGLLERNGITMHSANFEYTSDFGRITAVKVQVTRTQAEETRRVPFIRIEPIQLQTEAPPEDPLINEVKNLISGFYNLPDTHIYVEVLPVSSTEVNPR